MFADLQKLRRVQTRSVDICVVGAGPAGITLVDEMLTSGQSILLAESGGLSPNTANQALCVGESVGHPMNLMAGRYRAFGGSAIRWGGRCAMLDPLDMEARPWIAHSGWPLGWDELRPYYDRAKLSSNFEELWDDDHAFLERTGRVRPALQDDGLRCFLWRKAAPYTSGWAGRVRLGKQDGFNWGTARRERMRLAPNLEVLLHANLVALHPSEDGSRIQSATFRSLSGTEIEVTAQTFILCCGGIENARLLLEMGETTRARLDGRDHVGRYFAQHPRGPVLSVRMNAAQRSRMAENFGIFRHRANGGFQYEIGFCLSEEAQRTHRLVNASAGVYSLPDPKSGWNAAKRMKVNWRSNRRRLAGDVATVIADLPNVAGNLFRRFITGRPLIFSPHEVSVVVDLEQEPRADSRISLSETRDELGLRQAVIDWKISAVEYRTAAFMAERIAKEIRRLDLGDPEVADWVYDRDAQGQGLEGTFHFMGTTRMASSPSDGVLDADARCFGLDNLFVMGCSVFPSGGHANPTLTIIALAIRLADHLLGRSKPVSVPTDRAVDIAAAQQNVPC